MSRLVGKPTICICENKGVDQLRGNREADQRLCFRYSDSTISPLLNSKISSFKPAPVAVQVGLCQICSETTLLVFLRGGSYIIEAVRFNREFAASTEHRMEDIMLKNLMVGGRAETTNRGKM